MPDDQTKRGYPLPHPENIAAQDVVRIRTSIEKIDEDMSEREDELKNNFERFRFETFLNFWNEHH
ncbi:MAG: hypothetical protein ABS808_00335 [Wolbachia endosymbiont of Polyergus mexicanus]|uniref:Phage related protein n=1 Tax=Wolbachia endosymbiont of Polyergus mexicanus TaxID=3171167 RepID=A0AAU7YKK4_9RICK